MNPPAMNHHPAAEWTLTEVSSSFVNYVTTEDTHLFSPRLLTAVITAWVAGLPLILFSNHCWLRATSMGIVLVLPPN